MSERHKLPLQPSIQGETKTPNYSTEYSTNLSQDLEQESLSSKNVVKTTINIQEQELQEFIATLGKPDILQLQDFEEAAWKEQGKTSNNNTLTSRNTLEKLDNEQISVLVNSIRDRVDSLSRNSVNPQGDIKFEKNSDQRVLRTLKFAVTYATQKIKEAMASNPESNEHKEEITKLAAEVLITRKQIIEPGTVDELYKSSDLLSKIKQFEIVKFAIVAQNEVDCKICSIIGQMVDNPVTTRMIQNFRTSPHFAPKIGNNVERELGLTIAAVSVITQVERHNEEVTLESVFQWENKLLDWQFDFARIGNNGLRDQIIEFEQLYNRTKLMSDELANNDSKFKSYAERYNFIIWYFLPKLMNPKNKSQNNPTFKQYAHILHEICTEAKNLTHDHNRKIITEDTRYQIVVQRLKDMDAVIAPSVLKQDTPSLNFVGKGGKGKPNPLAKGEKGSNHSGKRTTNICANILRHGNCDKQGCTFESMTRADWEKRLPCNKKTTAKCGNGRSCWYMHEGDKYVDNPNCVHKKKGSINQVSEDSSTNDLYWRQNEDGEMEFKTHNEQSVDRIDDGWEKVKATK